MLRPVGGCLLPELCEIECRPGVRDSSSGGRRREGDESEKYYESRIYGTCSRIRVTASSPVTHLQFLHKVGTGMQIKQMNKKTE